MRGFRRIPSRYSPHRQSCPIRPAACPRKIFTSSFPIADLELSQHYNQARQGYDSVLVILGLDRSHEALQVRSVDIRTGNVESDERFTIPGLKGMTFFSSALREDLTPVYSFFDSEGGLWVAQPRARTLDARVG